MERSAAQSGCFQHCPPPFRGACCNNLPWGLEIGRGRGVPRRVVVFGAGPIGLFAMLTCKVAGAPVMLVKTQPYRRQLAPDLGADVVVNPTAGDMVEQVLGHTGGRGATPVLECSGSDGALEATMDIVAKEGRIVLIGQSGGRKIPIEIGKSI